MAIPGLGGGGFGGGGLGIPGLGPSPGATALDQPPPSPTPMGGGGPFSMQGLVPPGAQPQVPSNQIPPEVLTGLTQAAQTINTMLDSFAQITPDRAPQVMLLKDMLQQYLADVMGAGAGPVSPTATGPAFPGGGIDRGVAGAGAI